MGDSLSYLDNLLDMYILNKIQQKSIIYQNLSAFFEKNSNVS